jgi:hypothetical protein
LNVYTLGIKKYLNLAVLSAVLVLCGCAMAGVPDARNVNIPTPTTADGRKQAINDRPDSVMYLPLGEDILVPEVTGSDQFPNEMVGPFELRGETLAGALQLILADYDISIAFESQAGMTRRITVANLRGDLGKVVNEVCSLANLYCSYNDGTLTVKDTQTFTVTLPPIGADDDTAFLTNVSEGLAAILGAGADPIVVFETYIWEVSLDSGHSTGIDWAQLQKFGKFNANINLDGGVGADFTNPISIGLPTTQDIVGTPNDIIEFLSQFGAVKTISQPQITVLSGSEAELRVADTQNYVSQIATTLDEGQSTTSVNTDSVDTGFTLTIGSTWDKSTVYANVDIELTDVKRIDNFAFSDTGDAGGSTTIQLPQTSERQLTTQIRVRPGDSVLIAGLKRENDNFDTRGVGFMKPVLPTSRTAQTQNLELVIMMRPRVIVYTGTDDKRYLDYAMKKHTKKTPAFVSSIAQDPAPRNVYSPESAVMPSPSPISTQPFEPISSGLSPLPEDIVPVSPVSSAPLPEPAAAAVKPSWESAPPEPSASTRAGSVSEDMESVMTKTLSSPPSTLATPAPAGSSPVTTYPLEQAAPVYPAPATSMQPAVTGSVPRSPYEAYDYYTSGR